MVAERDALSYADALERILAAATVLPSERLTVGEALGRHLAEPLLAGADSPPFDNSAVDGYGVRPADLAEAAEGFPVTLALAGSVHAGDPPSLTPLRPGTTARILTGAPIQAGVEAVVMQEDVVVTEVAVHFSAPIRMGANIRRQGEEYRQGATLAEPGDLCTPALVALAAAAGHSHLLVSKFPSVAIVSTGDELVRPGDPLAPGQIWESNSVGLLAALRAMGVEASVLRAADTEESVRVALTHALEADVVLTSGGVSVGDRDFVKAVCEDLGVERRFWGTRIKPGGPLYLGTLGEKLVFGLPGNPVSALVTFFVLVRPAIMKMIGASASHGQHHALLTSSLTAKAERLEFVRGKLQFRGTEVWAQPIEARGSHMASGLAAADCLVHLPPEAGTIEAGAQVEVTPLRWSDL